jgi:very-short-patch-repair endonuclease
MPGVCIFVDGPKHDSPDALKHDSQVRKQLEDKGFRVIGIRFNQDFEIQLKLYLDILKK